MLRHLSPLLHCGSSSQTCPLRRMDTNAGDRGLISAFLLSDRLASPTTSEPHDTHAQ